MSLNETVSAERLHIAFFGKRNAGKSSLVNAVTGQNLAVVSPVKGTTTDPVQKAMELLPLGPVVVIDTPGYDDEGELGALRVEKTNEVLNKTDIAVLVYDATLGMCAEDEDLLEKLQARKIPVILAANKAELLEFERDQGSRIKDQGLGSAFSVQRSAPVEAVIGRPEPAPSVGAVIGRPENAPFAADAPGGGRILRSAQNDNGRDGSVGAHGVRPPEATDAPGETLSCRDTTSSGASRHLPLKGKALDAILVSARTGAGVNELKERLADLGRSARAPKFILADLVSPGNTVILVVPIDESAPKGRLILPQQQTLRELLDLHCVPICCQAEELPAVLDGLKNPPRLVVTDSQAFGKVSPLVPSTIPLTSFSILFARYKGQLATLAAGAKALSKLQDGNRVLISEGCTHHRQCNDIGTVKIPGWVRNYTGKVLDFAFSSGGEFPEDLSGFDLVIHCGGCMLNEAAMQHRIAVAQAAGVPMVNYGMAIAQMHGILSRSLEPFTKELS